MKCRVCFSPGHRVIETVDSGEAIRRRRKCDRCGHRWTTWERLEAAAPAIDVEAIRAALPALQALVGRE